MTWRLLLITALLLVPWSVSPAVAHTDLVSVSPGDGERASDWPADVVLVFTEPIDPTLSAVSVSIDGRQGIRVALERGSRDAELVGDLRDLRPADPTRPHRVRMSYRVTSTDGHPIAGTSTFAVAPDARSRPTGGDTEDSGATEDTGDTGDTGREAAPETTVPAAESSAGSGPGAGVWVAAGLVALVVISVIVSSRTMRSANRTTDGEVGQ